MEEVATENEQNPPINPSKHDWVHLTYIITFTLCFIIEVYQRISINLYYKSCQCYHFDSIELKKFFSSKQTLIFIYMYHL